MENTSKELRVRLEDWAFRCGALQNPYVVGLMRALESDNNLVFWSRYSAITELPQPTLTKSGRLTVLAKRIDQFRNVMVFTPIAFTWASISVAATSYASFTKANSAINLNFLDFWENGYDVLPAIWKLSNVAIIDFLLIVSIIFASIYANRIENRMDALTQDEMEQAKLERLELALEIDLYLNNFVAVTPATINKSVQNSIRALNQISKDLVKLNREMAKRELNLNKQEGIQSKLKEITVELRKVQKNVQPKTKK